MRNAAIRQIDLLVERRQALITAAVTGEIGDSGGGGVSKASEAVFEDAITQHLVEPWWLPRLQAWGRSAVGAADFDAVVAGVDTAELFAFIGATQAREWSAWVISTTVVTPWCGAAEVRGSGWRSRSMIVARSTCCVMG
jgi:hypothetical protein